MRLTEALREARIFGAWIRLPEHTQWIEFPLVKLYSVREFDNPNWIVFRHE